jgi:hypothetical protein
MPEDLSGSAAVQELRIPVAHAVARPDTLTSILQAFDGRHRVDPRRAVHWPWRPATSLTTAGAAGLGLEVMTLRWRIAASRASAATSWMGVLEHHALADDASASLAGELHGNKERMKAEIVHLHLQLLPVEGVLQGRQQEGLNRG